MLIILFSYLDSVANPSKRIKAWNQKFHYTIGPQALRGRKREPAKSTFADQIECYSDIDCKIRVDDILVKFCEWYMHWCLTQSVQVWKCSEHTKASVWRSIWLLKEYFAITISKQAKGDYDNRFQSDLQTLLLGSWIGRCKPIDDKTISGSILPENLPDIFDMDPLRIYIRYRSDSIGSK